MAERVFQRAQAKRARAGSDHVAARPPVVSGREAQDVLCAPGEPLSAPVGQEMQARLGADFSQVPVHADGTARAPRCRGRRLRLHLRQASVGGRAAGSVAGSGA